MNGTTDLSALEKLITQIRAIRSGPGSEQATREMAVNPSVIPSSFF